VFFHLKLELPVCPDGKDVGWSAVDIITGVVDELIVESEPRRLCYRLIPPPGTGGVWETVTGQGLDHACCPPCRLSPSQARHRSDTRSRGSRRSSSLSSGPSLATSTPRDCPPRGTPAKAKLGTAPVGDEVHVGLAQSRVQPEKPARHGVASVGGFKLGDFLEHATRLFLETLSSRGAGSRS
jgi:hypothetical protein